MMPSRDVVEPVATQDRVERRFQVERREMMRYGVVCGIDVGKTSSFAVVLDQVCEADEPLVRREVPMVEYQLETLFMECQTRGNTLVVVDQYGSFGSLVVQVARKMGMDVAHISPDRFSKVAATWGEDKSDARDATIIADAARTTPRVVDRVPERPEAVARIRVLSGERDDCVTEKSRLYNKLHALITTMCPTLEELFSKDRLHNKCELEIIARYGGPQGLREAGKDEVSARIAEIKYMRNRGPRKVAEVFEAIGRQTVTVPAADEMEAQARRTAKRILELQGLEKDLDDRIDGLAGLVEEVRVLLSLPGVGRVYAACIACEIGDIARFKDPNHLASYGGVAPARHESGTSVKKRKRRKGGNRRPENAFMQSARAASKCDPRAKAYYERKLAQYTDADGKQLPGATRRALRALARRRVTVIFAMLRDGSLYEPSHQSSAA